MTNAVRQLREGRGLSQGQLAAELRVSRQTVNAIETGRYLPRCRWHLPSPGSSACHRGDFHDDQTV